MFSVMVTSIVRICLLLWGEKSLSSRFSVIAFQRARKKNILAEFSLCLNLDILLHFYCFDTARLFYETLSQMLQIGAYHDGSI